MIPGSSPDIVHIMHQGWCHQETNDSFFFSVPVLTASNSEFQLHITISIAAKHTMEIDEEGHHETGKYDIFQHSAQTSSHEITHLEPCAAEETPSCNFRNTRNTCATLCTTASLETVSLLLDSLSYQLNNNTNVQEERQHPSSSNFCWVKIMWPSV